MGSCRSTINKEDIDNILQKSVSTAEELLTLWNLANSGGLNKTQKKHLGVKTQSLLTTIVPDVVHENKEAKE